MSVRDFNGSTDRLQTSNGTMGAVANAAHTMLVLIKPPTWGANEAMFSLATTGTMRTLYSSGASDIVAGGDVGTDRNMAVGVSTAAWQILGFHVTASGGTPRGHRKVLGSGSWTHADAAGVLTANATSITNVKFSTFGDSTGPKDERLALAAVWTSALTDTDFVNIESNASTAFLLTLSPAACWEFTQASTGTNVTDVTGHGADQTSITGTTVVNGDDPAWTFGTTASTTSRTFSSIPLMGGH